MVVALGTMAVNKLSQIAQDNRSNASQAAPVGISVGSRLVSNFFCDASCTDHSQCQEFDRGFICYRPEAGKIVNWTEWLDSTEAVVAISQHGVLTGFDKFQPVYPGIDAKQYAVVGGKLFVRTSPQTGPDNESWTPWVGPNPVMNDIGSGELTHFSQNSYLDGNVPSLKQYAVKGGQLWERSKKGNENWSLWNGDSGVMPGVGNGILTGFSQYTMPDGTNKQYLVKGGELWVRVFENGQWQEWVGPNSAPTAGTGTLTSFVSVVQSDGSTKQLYTRGGYLIKRDDANGRCRKAIDARSLSCGVPRPSLQPTPRPSLRPTPQPRGQGDGIPTLKSIKID